MMPLSLAALVQASILSMGAETYAEAYALTVQTGRPMLVLVGADWCAACKVMQHTILPQIRQRRALDKVSFAIVNLDQDRELGSQLTSNGPIPQLVMYRKAHDGWRRRRMIGCQSVEGVEAFINQGIQLDLADKEQQARSDPGHADTREASPSAGRLPDASTRTADRPGPTDG